MDFLYPQVLLLLLLLPLVWRYATLRRVCPSALLRLLIVALVVLALSRPYLKLSEPGTDVLLLVDRSASCADAAGRTADELQPLLRKELGADDRLGVISFAGGAAVERPLSAQGESRPAQALSPFASDLADALRLAGQLRAPERRTVALLLSDGLYTGLSPLDPAVIADARGLPVWCRDLNGGGGDEAAAGAIVLPERTEPRAAWMVRFSIFSTCAQMVEYELARGGRVLTRGKTLVNPGENPFFARDTADGAGVLEYVLEIKPARDRVRENNRSAGVLRVEGAPRVLLVSASAQEGLIGKALRAAAIPVDFVAPAAFPESAVALAPYKVVILENSPLRFFPGKSMQMLAEQVRAGLCALLVTGGPGSFGTGGYHRSPLDPLLPVSLEMRSDKKRGVMALAIAMDRSGSMAIPLPDGRTKMEQADLAAAEAIRLLSPLDQVSVIAVDSLAHVVVPLSRADNTDSLVNAVLRIRSEGGGIFVHTALVAARKEVEKSKLPTRHLILFADAADSEEQEGCYALAEELRKADITLSVIAMGTQKDSDAEFLKKLAATAGSEALFSEDLSTLPQLFTQEVMRVSRRGFLVEQVQMQPLPALSTLGLSASVAAPQIAAYNFSSLREGAVCFFNLDDEFKTPLLALRQEGKALCAAALFEADGEFSGGFSAWARAPELMVSLVRRLAGGVHYAGARVYAREAEGTVEIGLELSEDQARLLRGRDLPVELKGPGGITVAAKLEWTGAVSARAVAQLPVPGHYLPVIDLGEAGRAPGPGVTLSYSAEFAPRGDFAGTRTLRELAAATGGAEALSLKQMLESASVEREGTRSLLTPLLCALLLLFLTELAGRRLHLFA